MTELGDNDTNREGCPKRVWVMTTLSDDELTTGDTELPQGLRFHLARCESCRALADRLLQVTGSLYEIAQLEPADELASRAESRAREALRAGANLTGRVEIPDTPDASVTRSGGVRWANYTRYAAAAVIVFASGVYVGSNYFGTQRQVVVQEIPGGAVQPFDRPGSLTNPPQERSAGERLADEIAEPDASTTEDSELDVVETSVADAAPGPKRRRRAPRSPVEASQVDDPNYLPKAFFLPDATQRTIGAGPAIDKTGPIDSTTESDSEPRDDR